MDRMDKVQELALKMQDLCFNGGIPPFDRIRFTTHPDEVWFHWDERKLVVVVALDDDPADLAASLAGMTAGDPALN